MTWESGDFQVCFPILLSLIAFIVYWFSTQSPGIKVSFYNRFPEDKASTNHFLYVKLSGFVFLGIIPAILSLIFLPEFSLVDYGLSFKMDTAVFSLLSILILSLIVVPLAAYSAHKGENLKNYPQIRTREWTRKIYISNLIGWALYLLAYEFLFRGILLIPLVDSLGIWPAIAINIALYSATHIPKGATETIGAIPLGLVLCILTIASGTIWIAFFVHLAMAWSNSLSALKHHPEIHYKSYGK